MGRSLVFFHSLINVFYRRAAACLVILMTVLVLAGCINVNIKPPASPTQADTPGPAAPTAITPPPDGAPRSLYFRVQSAVWVLRPNAYKAVRLTPEGSLVTAFDVWQDDGRIAYGTESGELYVRLPGQETRLLIHSGTDSPYPTVITGVAWSPDGNRLAYTVDYEQKDQPVTPANPSSPSGVWITPLSGGAPTWLISNYYSSSLDEEINKIRRFSDPRWSPDGKALLLQAVYWEWSNQHWLYPLEYSEDDRNLHTLTSGSEGGLSTWFSAEWMPDSQGLLYSGLANAMFSDLVWVSRDGAQSEPWIQGKLANLYIYGAQMVPADSYLPGSTAGIAAGPGRMVYLASCPECLDAPQARLWAMKTKLIDPSQNAGAIGPEKLCSLKDSFGNANTPRHIEWRADFSSGVLTCGSNEIYLLNLRRDTPTETCLTPVLPALAPDEVPEFRWGEIPN